MSYLIPLHLEAIDDGEHSPHTIAKRTNVLWRLHEWLPFGVAYASTDQLNGFMQHKVWSRATRCTYDNHIRQAYRWWTKYGHMDGDPSIEMTRPKQPTHLPHPATDADLAAALGAGEPVGLIALLAAYEGMRVSEIAAADREDINQESTLIPVGKGGRVGIVPTHPLVWERVRSLPAGPLITDRRGHEVTGHWVSQLVRRRLNKIGLSDSAHDWRHWYGTTLQRLYRDVRVTQECLRHASVATTMVYTLVTGQQRSEAVGTLPILTVNNVSVPHQRIKGAGPAEV